MLYEDDYIYPFCTENGQAQPQIGKVFGKIPLSGASLCIFQVFGICLRHAQLLMCKAEELFLHSFSKEPEEIDDIRR